MSHQDFIKQISQYIQYQFPAIYREDGSALVALVEAYYEWMEENGHLMNREMFEYRDIDATLAEFVTHFKEKYLKNFPYVISTDNRFVIKHIMDFYRSKGSEKSIKLLMKLLFNEEVSVYYPKNNVIKPSDSLWVVPRYLEVTHKARTISYLNKTITGSKSGAKAFVESIVTKRVHNKLIDVVYISQIRGQFQTGDIITDDKTVDGAPTVIGSLSQVEIVDGGLGFAVGDILYIMSDDGQYGKARVTEIENATGRISFTLVDGGFGYSFEDTVVYIADATIFLDNANAVFTAFDTLEQRLETISANTASLPSNTDIGDVVVGYDANDNQVANGVIVASDADSIVVQVESGTFMPRQQIELTSNSTLFLTEDITSGSTWTLGVANSGGTFTVGEKIYQRDVANNLSTHYAFGTVQSVTPFDANTVTVVVDSAFGDFMTNVDIIGSTSGANGYTETAVETISNIDGIILEQVNESILIVQTADYANGYSSGDSIRGAVSKNVAVIANTVNVSAVKIAYDAANVVISPTDVSNTYAQGTLIGQNAIGIGISGNTYPFYAPVGATAVVYNQDGVSTSFNRVAIGSGAGFTITDDSIINKETVTINTDLVGGTNIAGVVYNTINLDGSNSGVGYVESVNVISGGTGYTNTSIVTFSGGGANGDDPYIVATGTVTTDGTGSIVSVNIVEQGEGYWSAPTLSVADGASASLVVNMRYGYGFPEFPYAGIDTIIADSLATKTTDIGEISKLSFINTGDNYNTDLFVSIINPLILAYNKSDLLITPASVAGDFVIGETIIDQTTGAKGIYVGDEDGKLKVKRITFDTTFSVTHSIVGQTTGTSAIAEDVELRGDDPVMGENAIVLADVLFSDGVIKNVDIINSGFGYIQDGNITLMKAGDETIVSGISKLVRSGVADGFWKTKTSHIYELNHIHDNYYYQEYSYEVRAGISLNRYENVLKDLLHVSGTALFGAVEKRSVVTIDHDIDSSLSKI